MESQKYCPSLEATLVKMSSNEGACLLYKQSRFLCRFSLSFNGSIPKLLCNVSVPCSSMYLLTAVFTSGIELLGIEVIPTF